MMKRASGVFPIPHRAGSYFIIMDNQRNRTSRASYHVRVGVPARFSEHEAERLRAGFQDLKTLVDTSFIAPDFNLILKPCGEVNAMSHVQTGDITICTELLMQASRLRSKGQIIGIILHELGHSLLNFWQNPSFMNEETADAFATYMLMVSGDARLVEEFAQSFEKGNPWAEAQHIIEAGDRHPISVQRARTIRQNASYKGAFISRWNQTVYPHLTNHALRSIIKHPGKYGDTSLAQRTLRGR